MSKSCWLTWLPVYLEVIPSCDEMEAFKDVDVAMLVGAMPRREGMERKDLLAANVKIFKSQGQAIDKVAKKTIKVGYSIGAEHCHRHGLFSMISHNA